MGIFDFIDNLFKSKFQRYMELHDKREYRNDIIYVIDEKKSNEIFEANRKSGLHMQLGYSIPPGSKILSRKENLEYYDKLVSDFEGLSNNNSQNRFYTMPNTDTSNEQIKLANWCYKNPKSCKEGNGSQCIANIDPRNYGVHKSVH